MELKDYLHLYLGCDVMTPDGIGKLVGLPYSIVGRDRVIVHFGRMVKTKNSIDGGYDKTRNHGAYAIHAARYEPIGSVGITEDGFDMPGGVKPILRPLSDMTEGELQECGNLVYDFSDDQSGLDLNNHKLEDFLLTTSEQFHWLLKKGFDLFGLIPAGLAIDKTSINKQK